MHGAERAWQLTGMGQRVGDARGTEHASHEPRQSEDGTPTMQLNALKATPETPITRGKLETIG